MNRRGFLGTILAAATAPAAIGSGILMPVKQLVVPQKKILLFDFGAGLWEHYEPMPPTFQPGSLWYDKTNDRMYICDGDGWHNVDKSIRLNHG